MAEPAKDLGERLLDAKEVAAILHVPVSWVETNTRNGELPHVALGRYRRYRRDAVLEWVEQHNSSRWRKHHPRVL